MRSLIVKNPSIVLLLSSVLWGLIWLPLKAFAALGLDELTLIAASYGLLTLLVAPRVWYQRNKMKTAWKPLLSIAVAGGLANLCFSLALIYGEVLRVMVLFYLLPVWGVLGGRFILKEPVDIWRWGGVVLAVVGALVLLGGGEGLWVRPSWIDLLAILSGMALAGNILLFRGAEQVKLAPKLFAMFAGSAMLALVALVVAQNEVTAVSFTTWLWLIAYSVVWLLWANVGVQWAVTQMPASRSSILIVMELVTAILSGWLIGNEQLTGSLILGGGLILSATAIEVARSR